jgi:exo-1,4-beta-D-glucosaminidase
VVSSTVFPEGTRYRLDLRENWLLQSSCMVNVPGDIVSTTEFTPAQWYKATIPSTVLAAQVANGEFHDIFFAKNLRKLPGMEYRIGQLYWWYRTDFQLPPDFRGRRVWLHLD